MVYHVTLQRTVVTHTYVCVYEQRQLIKYTDIYYLYVIATSTEKKWMTVIG